jgi:hypothetical protein
MIICCRCDADLQHIASSLELDPADQSVQNKGVRLQRNLKMAIFESEVILKMRSGCSISIREVLIFGAEVLDLICFAFWTT